MAGDVLPALLAMVRAELPDVPEHVWAGIEASLRGELGGQEHYIARRAKATHLARLEAAASLDENASNAELENLLGVSVRRIQQLKKLRRP